MRRIPTALLLLCCALLVACVKPLQLPKTTLGFPNCSSLEAVSHRTMLPHKHRIQGSVYDEAGYPLDGATAHLRGPGEGQRLEARSNIHGEFVFPLPPFPGPYSLEVTAAGRYSAVLADLPCAQNRVVEVRAVLCPDGIITFRDFAPMVDSDSAGGGATIQIDPRTGEPSVHSH